MATNRKGRSAGNADGPSGGATVPRSTKGITPARRRALAEAAHAIAGQLRIRAAAHERPMPLLAAADRLELNALVLDAHEADRARGVA